MKDKMCSECNTNISTFITRENKQSPAIHLCAKCANNKKYLKWGVVSCHTYMENDVSKRELGKKFDNDIEAGRDVSVIEGLQRKTRRTSKKNRRSKGKK